MGDKSEIHSVTFSPDGNYLLAASHDGTARLWITELNETIRAVCALFTRDLAVDELVQFEIADQGPSCPAQTRLT